MRGGRTWCRRAVQLRVASSRVQAGLGVWGLGTRADTYTWFRFRSSLCKQLTGEMLELLQI